MIMLGVVTLASVLGGLAMGVLMYFGKRFADPER
jgi:hypothetical protein